MNTAGRFVVARIARDVGKVEHYALLIFLFSFSFVHVGMIMIHILISLRKLYENNSIIFYRFLIIYLLLYLVILSSDYF